MTLKGLFALSNYGPMAPAILLNPNIDGCCLRTFAGTVWTGPGSYYWSTFDAEVARVEAAGKRWTACVTFGRHTPLWMYQNGVAKFTYKDGSIDACPVPWNQTYLAILDTFINAFGVRYRSHPGFVGWKLGGIGGHTEELYLPRSSLDVAEWCKLGYKPSKVLSAFNAILQSCDTHLDQAIMLQVIPNAWPGISESGSTTRNQFDENLTNEIINYSLNYDSVLVMNDALTGHWAYQRIKNLAGACATGFQFLTFIQGGDGQMKAGMPGSPTDSECARAALNLCIGAGAKYLEIYPKDLLSTDPAMIQVVSDAHAALSQ